MTEGDCHQAFCKSDLRNACRNECDAAELDDNKEEIKEDPDYDEDSRDYVSPYKITKKYNFIVDATYS